MVISERKNYYYLDNGEIVVNKIRDKYNKKEKSKVNRVSKASWVLLIILFFCLCVLLLVQYSRVSTINRELIQIENELEDVKKMNDTKEGMVISGLNLDEIERTAKEDLGMVEPSDEQYSYIAINNSNLQADEEQEESIEERADLSWLSRLID